MQRQEPIAPAQQSALQGVAVAALLIAVGNVASRLLGLARESIIAFFFGRGAAVDAFTLAWTVPNMIYDLLINGAVSAALVPVFSEYAEGDQREFWRVVSSIITIALSVLTVLVALIAWQAPLVVNLLVRPEQVALREQTTTLVRLLLPAVFFMGMSGLTTAVLHARRRFFLPAFVGTMFNSGMIVGVVFFHNQLGVASLAAGAIVGAVGQVLIQLPGLRNLHYRPQFNLNHPAVRRILLLYAPVALGISFSLVGALIDRWLASGFPAAPATMRYATTLIQFPLGLVAAAVSLAILPTLSRQSASADETAFRQTLGMGLKVVLLLIVPATVGLAVLAQPIVAILFQRGAFGNQDSAITALALLFYLPGLPAAAIDQVLLFAFYARKNTLTPNLVQGAAIGFYLLAALPLLFFTQLGLLALVIGNSVQWIGHAILLFALLRRHVSFAGTRLGEAAVKAIIASIPMAAAVYGLQALLAGWSPIVTLGLAGVIGGLLYVGVSMVLRVEALGFFVSAVARRFGR